MEITLEDFKLAFLALLKNKLLIALVTLAGLFAGLFYTSFQTSEYTYESTASVCVTYTTYQEQFQGANVMTNYADIIMSDRVCGQAAALLGEPRLTAAQLQRMIRIKTPSANSYVMWITAEDRLPERAIRVANAVAEAFTSQVSNLSGNQSIQVLDSATMATIASDDGLNKIRILAPLCAFVLVCGWIAVRELLSDKVRSIPQCVDDEDEILTLIPYTE